MRRVILYAVLILTITVTVGSNIRADEGGASSRLELVVVSGEPARPGPLAPLFGTAPDNLSLFAMTPSGFEPVPFQIDQRYLSHDELKGPIMRHVYTNGKDKHTRPDPDPNLDVDDELVFWSGDAGVRVQMDKWPKEVRGVEIVIKDPLTGAEGYVYLLAFDHVAPRTERRYVRYFPAEDRIESLYYNLDFPEEHKIGFVDMAITPEAGGSGEDFVDEAKYRSDVWAVGTMVSYEIT